MKKRMCVLLLILSLVISSSVFAAGQKKGVWKHNKKGWWYEYSDGSYAKSQWLKIDGSKYYFNAAGYRVTGWKTINKKKYRFNAKGIMQTGWKTIDGKKYYFNAQGVLNTKKTLKIKGKVYHFNKDCSLHTKHSYKLVSKKEATCTKKGKKTYKCSCGDTYTKTIKATGHKFGKEWSYDDIIQEQVIETVPWYIGYNGYDFNAHGYTTKKQVQDKIIFDLENNISEADGGCGCFGYTRTWKYIVVTPYKYKTTYKHACKNCGYEEVTKTKIYTSK